MVVLVCFKNVPRTTYLYLPTYLPLDPTYLPTSCFLFPSVFFVWFFPPFFWLYLTLAGLQTKRLKWSKLTMLYLDINMVCYHGYLKRTILRSKPTSAHISPL